MDGLKGLKEAIADTLSAEKAYSIPAICERFGLDSGDKNEAFASKRSYILRRLQDKDDNFCIQLARQITEDYNSVQIGKALSLILPDGGFKITNITRKKIISELEALGDIGGKLDLLDFLKKMWPIDVMPSSDRFDSASHEIWQHMINNDDWSYNYLFETYLELPYSSDKFFFQFLEQVVHPMARDNNE